MDKKVIAIIVLSIALAVSLYINFNTNPAPYDDTLVKQRENALQEQNKQLLQDINTQTLQKQVYLHQIDSLSKVEPQIKIVYVNKTKQIDNGSVNTIVSDFTGVFAESGIK